ncbi:hypothetical protein K501DRAFT_225100 [Backusella circina FSU 941]|nr:hypothetical protein K501DRAFT_225100 [Backusella circina FSU 941]
MTKAKRTPATKNARQSSRSTTVPEMFMRQKFSNRAKQQDSSDEESDQLESSEEDNSSDSETEQKKKPQRRHKTGKKTATRVDLDEDSQLLEQVTEDSIAPDNIFENVVAEEESIEDLVKKWVKKYQKNNKWEALRDLINFIIRSSGCLIAVTVEALVKDDGAVEALQELQEKLVSLPSTDYPIASRVKEHKPFKKNLLLFFHELIEQCQGGAIYDGALIETLQNWLTTMSSSVYRPFRHTATIIALRIMTSLCIVADRTRVEITNNTRQSNTAKKHPDTQKNKQTLLKATAATLVRKRKDLDLYLTEFFENIFVHRSHDVESVIRAECMKELCQFIQNYQSRFVDNSYLRYFGWAFNDQHASVRCEVVKSVTRLYKMEDLINKLAYFTERFTERLEEMALYDVDVSVRVNTVALLSYLFQKKKAVLSEHGRMHLSRLIVSDVARVRNSAAPFIKAVIESELVHPLIMEAQKSLAEAARGGRRATRHQEEESVPVNKTWITFKAFAGFLVKQVADTMQHSAHQNKKKKKKENEDDMDEDDDEEMEVSEDEEDATLINTAASKELSEKRHLIITKTVEALWTQMKELQDYDAMSEYLCRDHSQTNNEDEEGMGSGSAEIEACYRLNNDEETVLVNVYVVCLKTAVERGLETQLVGIKDRRKIDPAILEECKNEISRHLVPTLPKLITKHSDDANKLVHLVHAPTLMNLNVYMVLQQEREYEALLQSLIKIYLGATLTTLLQNCSQSMAHMSSVSYLSTVNDIEFVQLQEAVVKQVRDACAGTDLVTARFTPNTTHSISVSIARLDYLISFSDATPSMDDAHGTTTNTIEYVGQLVDRASMGYQNELELSKSVLSILSRYFLWKCHAVSVTATDDLVHLIERRRDWVMDRLIDLVTAADGSPLEEMRVLALGYLVDAYWILSSDHFDHANLQRLKISCSNEVQKVCTEYVEEQIDAWKDRVVNEAAANATAAAAAAEEEAKATAPKPTTKKAKEKEKEKQKEREAAEKKRQELIKTNKALNQLFYQILIAYARGITVGVFEMEHAPILLDLYGPANNDATIEGVIKALVAEFEQDVVGNVLNAEEVCRAYLISLKTSFEEHVGENNRSMDPTLKLARLQAGSLRAPTVTDASGPLPVPPPQVIAERIHIDGISYIFEKISDAMERSEHEEKANALKFFKVLSMFGKVLTRARDIAKLHNHLEDCMQQYNIEVDESQPEWGYYVSYVKTIDEVLKKKGLRYDPSMRANNAETPAAHVFDDTDMNDIPENPPQEDDDEEEEEGIGKRTRSSTDMDIDDKFVTKRRR